MKKKLVLILSLCYAASTLAQEQKPTGEILKVKDGIVVYTFIPVDNEEYCDGDAHFLWAGDSIRFELDSYYNQKVLERYPALETAVGSRESYEYDELTMKFHSVYTKCLYPFIYSIWFRIIKSPLLYIRENDKNVYAVFRFWGTINMYQGLSQVWGKSYEEAPRFDPEDDCPCDGWKRPNPSTVMILNNTDSVQYLTPQMEKRLKLKKFGKDSINIAVCE